MARRTRSGIGVLGDFIMTPITVLFAVLQVCAYLAPYVSPVHFWFFAFAGLIAPVIYVVNIMILFYWIVRWRYMGLVTLVILLAGAGTVSLFFRPSLSKHYNQQEGDIKIMTYNVEGFLDDNKGRYHSTFDSIASLVRLLSPDILALQEFQSRSADEKKRLDLLLEMNYNVVNYRMTNSSGGGWGTALYSRYPIVGHGEIDFVNSTNSVVWADIVVRNDTLRVFSCHLQTTSVDRDDRDYINNQLFIRDDQAREERVRNILGKLGRNYKVRAVQADSLAVLLSASAHDLIVCGDFNDTPMSYVYHKIRGRLLDTFVEKGQGMTNTNTYKGLFNMFRIDYIFHSRGYRTTGYRTLDFHYSDHKPVVATIEKR